MQKIALPVIFISATVAALFYISREEHGTGTLLLIAGVLLVGQICATLPFIFDAWKNRAAAPAAENSADTKKITANQQIIQDDLRALGEMLAKRIDAIESHQKDLAEKIHALAQKKSPDFSDAIDELFEKTNRAFEENSETLRRQIDEKISAAEKKLAAASADIDRQIDDLTVAIENLTLRDFDDESDDTPATPPEKKSAPENDANESDDENVPAIDDEFFDEPDDAENADAPADEKPAAEQGELDLGEIPPTPGATLTLDAMIGIGNKPFLRGNAPGLSEKSGTPMTFVEIGKWSYDFEPSDEEITVRILLNDDESSPLGDPVTLAPGQSLELAYTPDKA